MKDQLQLTITQTTSELLISFNGTTFDKTLKRFKRVFPHDGRPQWDETLKVWRVQKQYASYLVKFIATTISDDSNPYQLPLL
jgi:hypothetical protein